MNTTPSVPPPGNAPQTWTGEPAPGGSLLINGVPLTVLGEKLVLGSKVWTADAPTSR